MRNLLLLMPVVVLGLVACGEDTSDVPVSEALAYRVITKADNEVTRAADASTRKARVWAIYADGADTVTQRVHTALKAAMDAYAEGGVDYAEAHLLAAPSVHLMNTGRILALGQYAPDGVDGSVMAVKLEHGTWEARASEYTPTDLEQKILVLWYENRERFDKKGPFGLSQVDEAAMKLFIGGELGIPAEDVQMKMWQTYKYFPE